jgi:hypothetical protein
MSKKETDALLMEEHKQRWTKHVYAGGAYENYNRQLVEERAAWLWNEVELAPPAVLHAISPGHANLMATAFEKKLATAQEIQDMTIPQLKELVGTPNKYEFSSYVNYSDVGWVSHYEYYINKGEVDITEETKDSFYKTRDLVENVFMSLQFDVLFVSVRYPIRLSLNQENNLHYVDGYAVEWEDGTGQAWINGRFLEPKIFNACTDVEGCRVQFNKTDNADVQAAIVTIVRERWGQDALLEMLQAELVDTVVFNHANGYSETQKLYRTKEKYSWASDSKGNEDVKLAWQEMKCPSTGATYLISTCPSFDKAEDSAKWLRPQNVPVEIPYEWQSAN